MMTARILIVDDNEQIRELLKDFFQTIGHEVMTAGDGKEALEKFKAYEPDCIISDLKMPDMDGLELLRQIRAQGKKTTFLMITGYPTIETAVEAMKQGAYDYITKPLQLEDVRIKVERALHAQRNWKDHSRG